MISPLKSQLFGLVVSAVVGGAVGFAVWKFMTYELDFWHLGDITGPLLGIILGSMSAFEMFTTRLREIPLNWNGVSLFLGKPTGRIYENGNHWVFPFFGIRSVPASTEKFILEMPEEKIDAQDGSVVFFGVSEHAGKRNRVQYSIVEPTLYIATDNPEDELREAYLEEARLFFGQATKAIGVKNEKTLFSDFVALPSETEPGAQAKYAAFETRLRNVMFAPTGQPAERLFSEDSVVTIMNKAGNFKGKAASWGIGNIIAFTPNVRENPEAEQAAAQKQAIREQMAGLKTKTNQVTVLAKKMRKEVGTSSDLATAMVAKLSGQDVEIENKTINLSGFPEVLRELGKLAIDTFAKPGGSSDA